MKRFFCLTLILTLAAFNLAACARADGEASPYTEATFSKTDLNAEWDEADATRVTLNGGSADIAGGGAAFADGVLTISLPGDYVLSGDLSGSVVVDVGKNEKARLILNGVAITSSGAPAIWVKSADKTVLTLAEGTINTLTDADGYALAAGEDEPNACLFSKDDLSLNGGGALYVYGNYRHGVNCKDDLRIADGVISVVAVEDGVRGRDSLAVAGGVLTVESGGDGLHSGNDEEADKGLVALSGGEIAINAGSDGVQAAQRLQITGGNLRVTCGAGAGDVAADDYTYSRGGRDFWGNWDMGGDDCAVSMKGLKSDGDLIVAGGEIAVDSEDDSIHAAGDVTIMGGSLVLKSGDDGVHSDAETLIAGGETRVERSYEGVEGIRVTVTGGTLSVVASDDGINAAGTATAQTNTAETASSARQGGREAGGASFGGRGGMMMDANADNVLTVTDGSVYVNASGDGLDANGYIYIKGGAVVIDGPGNSGNGALDAGYGVVVTGGILIAAGAAGMEVTPDAESTQPSIYARSNLSTGDLFAVTDSNGALICAFTAAKSHASVIVSAPNLTLGATYALYRGGSASDADNGLFASGDYSAGEKIADVTLTETVTSFGGGDTWTNRFTRRGW